MKKFLYLLFLLPNICFAIDHKDLEYIPKSYSDSHFDYVIRMSTSLLDSFLGNTTSVILNRYGTDTEQPNSTLYVGSGTITNLNVSTLTATGSSLNLEYGSYYLKLLDTNWTGSHYTTLTPSNPLLINKNNVYLNGSNPFLRFCDSDSVPLNYFGEIYGDATGNYFMISAHPVSGASVLRLSDGNDADVYLSLQNTTLSTTGEELIVSTNVYAMKGLHTGERVIAGDSDMLYDLGINCSGYWPLDDNAASTVVIDYLGLNNGVSAQNTENMTTSGAVGSALSFNGSSDYIALSANSFLGADDWTVCGWFKGGSGSWRTFYAETLDGNNNVGYGEVGYNNGNAVRFITRDASANSVQIVTDYTYSDNEWYFFCYSRKGDTYRGMIFNDSGELLEKLYAYDNSVLDAITVDSATIGAKQRVAVDTFMNGDLDNIMVFKSCLSYNEVKKIVNGGSGIGTLTGDYTEDLIANQITNPAGSSTVDIQSDLRVIGDIIFDETNNVGSRSMIRSNRDIAFLLGETGYVSFLYGDNDTSIFSVKYDGSLYPAGSIYPGGGIYLNDNYPASFGSSDSDCWIHWETTGNDHLFIGTKVNNASYSGHIKIKEYGDSNVNDALGNVAYPCLDIFNDGSTKCLQLYQDSTHAKIGVYGNGVANQGVNITTHVVIDGNTDIGDAPSDTLTITARVDADIDPSANNSYDLGGDSLSWNEIRSYIYEASSFTSLNGLDRVHVSTTMEFHENILPHGGDETIGTSSQYFDLGYFDQIQMNQFLLINGDNPLWFGFNTYDAGGGTSFSKKTMTMICSVEDARTLNLPVLAGGCADVTEYDAITGVGHIGSTLGYWTLDDDRDKVAIGFAMPELFISSGTAASFEIEYEGQRTGGTDAICRLNLYASGNTTPIMTDTVTFTSAKGWRDQGTYSTGIGHLAGISVGESYVLVLDGDATDDGFNIFRIRFKYQSGVQNDVN